MYRYNIMIIICISLIIYCCRVTPLTCEQKRGNQLQNKCIGIVEFHHGNNRMADACSKRFPNGKRSLTVFRNTYASCNDSENMNDSSAYFIFDTTYHKETIRRFKFKISDSLKMDDSEQLIVKDQSSNKMCRLIKVNNSINAICEVHIPCTRLERIQLFHICIYDDLDRHCSLYGMDGTCIKCKSSLKTGAYCETVLSRFKRATNACDSNPCLNGGICMSTKTGFRCACPLLFRGSTCQIPNRCHPNPCKHDGICIENRNKTSCKCTAAYTGELCDIRIPYCEVLNPCYHNGTCTNYGNYFKCKCPTGYRGEFCEKVEIQSGLAQSSLKRLIFGLSCIIGFILMGIITICYMSCKLKEKPRVIKSPIPEPTEPDTNASSLMQKTDASRVADTASALPEKSALTVDENAKHTAKFAEKEKKEPHKTVPHYIEYRAPTAV